MLPNLHNYDCMFSLVVPLITMAFFLIKITSLDSYIQLSGFLTLTSVSPSKNYEFWASVI